MFAQFSNQIMNFNAIFNAHIANIKSIFQRNFQMNKSTLNSILMLNEVEKCIKQIAKIRVHFSKSKNQLQIYMSEISIQ